MRGNPLGWMAGSAATGLAASTLFGKRRAPKKDAKPVKRGLAGLLIGAGIAVAKPLARVWLANRVRYWVSDNLSASPSRASSAEARGTVKTL